MYVQAYKSLLKVVKSTAVTDIQRSLDTLTDTLDVIVKDNNRFVPVVEGTREYSEWMALVWMWIRDYSNNKYSYWKSRSEEE